MTDNDREWAEAHLAPYDDFAAFLRALERPAVRSAVLCRFHFMPQWYFVCDHTGALLVDHIVPLERFADEAAEIGARCGMDLRNPKKVNTSERGAWRDYYDARGAAIVERIYSRDFDVFGYARGL